MKMTLSPEAISTFVSELGSVETETLQDALSRVFGAFRGRHDPFSRKDIVAVLLAAKCKYDLTDAGHWATVSQAIADNSTPTGAKGFYTQTKGAPQGVRIQLAPAAASATSETPVEVDPDGEFWEPTPRGEAHELYQNDVGLRQLAMSKVSACFSFYSSSAAACRKCPVALFCSAANDAQLSVLAQKLDEDSERRLSQKTSETSKALTPPAPKSLPSNWKNTGPLPFAGVCSGCKSSIDVGVEAIHIEKKGIYHLHCAGES